MHSLRATAITIPILVGFCQQLVAAYPGATLTLVPDNRPIHFHPNLLVALVPQDAPFPHYLPASWAAAPSAAALRTWGDLALPIPLLPLPTYASWCNPIEKVWRKLRQELGHLHPWADDLPRVRTDVDAWLAACAHPSPEPLRYVRVPVHDSIGSLHDGAFHRRSARL